MPQVPVPGSRVWIRRRRWRVDRARIDRRTIRLDVSDRDRQLTVFTPYDVAALAPADRRPVHVRRQQARARLAHLLARAPHARLPAAVLEARIDVWPHQLEPLAAVTAGYRRLLIADEVGLGKTVQAGLVLAELLRRQPSLHALIVVPAALRAQWIAELHDRFSIRARSVETLLGGGGPRRGGDWRPPGVWIGSLDYLKQPHVFDALPLHPWDLVVIDEAHVTTGRSDRHEAADELGRRARHLLLLTATPHDGDAARFARLLRLGALPYAGDELLAFCRTRAVVPVVVPRTIRWPRLAPTPALARVLEALAAFEQMLLHRVRPAKHDAALLLLSIFRKRALSTMAAFERTLARRIDWLESGPFTFDFDWLQPPLDFGDDELDAEERMMLTADMGVGAALERTWLRRLRTLARTAMRDEPKLRWIRRAASRTPEPFVVFTEFRHSLEAVERALQGVRTVARVHGGLAEPQRQQAIRRFLDGDASVLLATDVCGQGLNLQTRARWIVNLELPWNPLRLEQRIGRVDRLGQTRAVHASLLVGGRDAEAGLLASLARRTLAARDSGASSLDGIGPPPHLAVAAAVIASAPVGRAATAARRLEPCSAFSRLARAQSRVLVRRRTLARCWRATSAGRPVVTRYPCAVNTGGRDLVVIGVPLADRTGEAVERCLMAFLLPGGTLARAGTAALAASLGFEAAGRVQVRIRRLERLRAAAAARRIAGEEAIAAHLHGLKYPEEVQLGLFSRRRGLAFVEARAQAARAVREASARVQFEEDRARVEAGTPAVEWAART